MTDRAKAGRATGPSVSALPTHDMRSIAGRRPSPWTRRTTVTDHRQLGPRGRDRGLAGAGARPGGRSPATPGSRVPLSGNLRNCSTRGAAVTHPGPWPHPPARRRLACAAPARTPRCPHAALAPPPRWPPPTHRAGRRTPLRRSPIRWFTERVPAHAAIASRLHVDPFTTPAQGLGHREARAVPREAVLVGESGTTPPSRRS